MDKDCREFIKILERWERERERVTCIYLILEKDLRKRRKGKRPKAKSQDSRFGWGIITQCNIYILYITWLYFPRILFICIYYFLVYLFLYNCLFLFLLISRKVLSSLGITCTSSTPAFLFLSLTLCLSLL